MTEPQLIQALAQGQNTAFEILVNEYKDRLYNTILGMVQNQADAEDLLQDVFIKVFENIQKFKGESAISTWMYRIAVTHSLDFIRRKNRKKRLGNIKWWPGNSPGGETEFIHPGVISENKERAVHLFKAINTLPDNQKTAFVLQKVEGLNQKDISAIMDLKEGALESLLMRAKANLKKSLINYYSS